jgi:hypothetical protein
VNILLKPLVRPSKAEVPVRPSEAEALVRPSKAEVLVRPSKAEVLVRPSEAEALLVHRRPLLLYPGIGNIIVILHLFIDDAFGCELDYPVADGFDKFMVMR